ncbi:hypothetical protein Ato02nite_080810 [Paractinoplanes toevensis]|uniref:Uncharacterized protein n=1 Tax=Paractinoplanes toevensis TaxID=571911 RepID=A0A919W9V8_9ACTN|nr:hypothetical protein Ato02nite_080810 [Actinoplanes toevensis]
MVLPVTLAAEGSLPGTNVPAGSDAQPLRVGTVRWSWPPATAAVPPRASERVRAPATAGIFIMCAEARDDG